MTPSDHDLLIRLDERVTQLVDKFEASSKFICGRFDQLATKSEQEEHRKTLTAHAQRLGSLEKYRWIAGGFIVAVVGVAKLLKLL